MKMKKTIIQCIILSIVIYFLLLILPSNSNQVFAGTLSSDINAINDSKYPGVKSMINALQSSNINYTFQVYYTGIDWNEAINREYQGHGLSPLNLFNSGSSYNGKWYCPICGTKSYDNGSLYCASKEAIAYMMDPRNSLTSDSVFQFKTLESSDVTVADISRVVAGKGSYLNNSEAIQAIYDTSTSNKINGYYLVAKIINEHGTNGSTLTSGTYPGYEKLYNYFNIGAYGNSTSAIISNGLTYARNKGWTSIRASITGGTETVKNEYIGKGQNTLYYQKFNVVYETSLFSHQYQQNIMAAESQSRNLKSYYTSSVNHTFVIPLYENMPVATASRPDTSVASSYSYEDAKVTNVSTSLKIRATPNGTIIGKLNNGESIKILERASSKVGGYYWDLTVSNTDGTYGYAAREVGGDVCLTGTGEIKTSTVGGATTSNNNNQSTSNDNSQTSTGSGLTENTILIEDTYINISPDITYETLISKYSGATVKDTSENVINSGTLCTGYSASIDGKNYIMVKKGDVNGDGIVSITDVILTLNHISTGNITDSAKVKATQVKASGGNTSVTDVIILLNNIK